MSWHFSRALVAAYLAENSSDGKQFVQLKLSLTPQAYLCSDRMTVLSRLSRFGMTFAPLTEDRGEVLLTLYLAGFPVRTSAQQERAQESMESEADCGEKWHGKPSAEEVKRAIKKQWEKNNGRKI